MHAAYGWPSSVRLPPLFISPVLPPDGWASDDYIMHAAHYPAVGRHWASYLRWARQWDASAAQTRLLRLYQERGREAGLTERQEFELLDPDLPGLSALGWDLELRRQFAREADLLHTALVESRGNAYVDDGRWWFADTRTQRAYGEHVQNLRRIAAELERNARLRAERLGVDPAVAVPPAVARLRPAGT